MKAKLKDKRLLLTAVFFCALAAMFLWPTEVKAATATAGDFTVTGDTSGYSFSNGVLTVNSGANLTIKNTDPDPDKATGNTIVVAGDASITLSGVNISVSNSDANSAKSPIDIKKGTATLTLHGDNRLFCTNDSSIHEGSRAALHVSENAGVILQGTISDSLEVTARGGNWGGAAIGGNAGADNNHTKAGSITIRGGTINAIAEGATQTAAAIGGGLQGDATKITISGGHVTAVRNSLGAPHSAHCGAAIGGGGYKGEGGTIAINGGTVIAHCNELKGSAVIGNGNQGPPAAVTITGGSVSAVEGAAVIQDGIKDIKNNVKPVTLTLEGVTNEADIKAFKLGKSSPSYGITDVQTDAYGDLYFYLPDSSIGDGTAVEVTTADGSVYSGTLSNGSATLKPFAGDIDLSDGSGNLYIWDDGYSRGSSTKRAYSGDYTLTGGTAGSPTASTVTVYGSYNGNPAGGPKKTITLNGVNIAASGCPFSIQKNADVNLMLSGDNTLQGGSNSAGLAVPTGASVTIDGTDADSLTATGAGYAAGIGGNYQGGSGAITINGGTITATGASYGAGIGGGSNNDDGDIVGSGPVTITGGSVTANSGGDGGAGIGGGFRGYGGRITITGGTVTANGKGGGAGIGGGKLKNSGRLKEGAGGEVTITGGSVHATTDSEWAQNIGHGSGNDYSGSSGTLKDDKGNNVYLNTLTVGESPVRDGTAITSTDSNDPNTLTNGYGVKDVVTMDGGKLYFYLPATTANNNPPIELKAREEPTVYSRNYLRGERGYTATLLPPPSYTITIPETVSFENPTWKPTGAGRYNDKTFKITPTALTNLTDGRSLSVTVKDGGGGTGTDYQLTGSDSSDTLNYQVYQGDSATGGALDAAGATLVNKWEKDATAQSGTLRLDQSQIKYSGRYTGTLTFTVNVVDSK